MAEKTLPPVPAKQPKKKQRINIVVAFFMMVVAVLFDLAQFLISFFHVIPVAGNAIAVVFTWFLSIVSAFSFGLWFALLGVSYFGKNSGKKLAIVLGSTVAELVPIINALPAISLGVFLLILQTKLEDADIKIGLADVAAIGLAAVPGGQVATAARAAQIAAKTTQATQAASATSRAASAAKLAKSRPLPQPDFGPGTKPQPKAIDINTPYRRVQPRQQAQDFAQPYVPANDNEEADDSARWVA